MGDIEGRRTASSLIAGWIPTKADLGPCPLSPKAIQQAFRCRWHVPPNVKWLIRVLEMLGSCDTNVCVSSIREIADAMNAESDETVLTLLLLAQDLRLVSIGPFDPVSHKHSITICRGTYLRMAGAAG